MRLDQDKTIRPIHYTVMLDEAEMEADVVQVSEEEEEELRIVRKFLEDRKGSPGTPV